MAKSARKLRQFWHADWFVGVLVVLAIILLHGLTDFFGTLERRYYDFASTSTSRQPSDRIAIIAIDDQSVANIGRWPWTRDVHAKLIDQLSSANKAPAVYEHMASFDKNHKDLQIKLKRAKNFSETVILGGGAAHPGGTILLDAAAGLKNPCWTAIRSKRNWAKAPWAWSILAKTPRSVGWWRSRP